MQYLRELGVNPKVFKNDEITISELSKLDQELKFSSIVISPGPKNPDKSGVSMDVIGEFYKTKKILGVCLGHQCIVQYFGCKVIKAKEPMHGKVSKIYFEGVNGNKLFEGLDQGFEATRYHSLIVDNDSIKDCIQPLAYTDDRVLMALKHRDYPIYGVQFHPEAILTEGGKRLLENFLAL